MFNKSNLIKISFGTIVVLLVGFGIILATRIFDPFWNPFRPSPERVILSAIQKMKELKTFRFETELDFQAKEKNEEVIRTLLVFKNDIDKSDSKDIKLEGDFLIDFLFNKNYFSLAGENKVIASDSYFKITTPPAPDFSEKIIETLGIDFNQIKDQWIKFDEESFLKAVSGNDADQEVINQQIKDRREAKVAAIKKIEELFGNYTIKRSLPDEEIEGVKFNGYLILLNKEEVKEALPELLGFTGQFLGPEGILNLGILEDLLPRMDEFFEISEGFPVEIWIGQKDNYIYKIKLDQEIDLARFTKPLKSGETPDVVPGKVHLRIETNFSDFNKPVKIEEPKETRDLQDIIPPDFYTDYIEYILGPLGD